MYKVENVPLPAVIRRGGPEKGLFRKTIESLEVGQSFIAGPTDNIATYRSTAHAIARKIGIKVSIRKEGIAVRLYRVE